MLPNQEENSKKLKGTRKLSRAEFIQDMPQRIIDHIRWHECSTGQKWPGSKQEGDPAVTCYPNLCAEIDAGGCFLLWPAQSARISEELLADVIESGAELTEQEQIRLSAFFDVPADYLFHGPALSIVDPRTDEGKLLRDDLYSALKLLRDDSFADNPFLCRKHIKDELDRALHVSIRLMLDFPVSYAHCRCAMSTCSHVFRLLASDHGIRGRITTQEAG